MYGRGALTGAVTTGTTAIGATMLPNTGSNVVVTVAISVAAGLVVWGALYARAVVSR